MINYDPSHVGRKKVGELWSTNKKVIGANVDTPKLNFSTDYICWPLKFLHALEIDQGLLAHTSGGLTLGSAAYFYFVKVLRKIHSPSVDHKYSADHSPLLHVSAGDVIKQNYHSLHSSAALL